MPITLDFERITVNGLSVLAAPRPGSGLVAATVLIRRGSADESEGEFGLASFTTSMLMRGTRFRSSRQLAFDLESIGAMAADSDGLDSCALTLRVAAEDVDEAFAILFEMLLDPAFNANEHEISRRELLAHLRMIEDDKFSLTYRAYVRNMFAGHGYGHPVEGEMEDALRVTPDQCRRWHAETCRPESCLLVVVGDLTTENIAELVRRYTESWQRSLTLRSRAKPPEGPAGDRLIELERPGLQQGFIVAGFRTPPLTHPDYPALRLASAALGEGFAGRIFTHLRDERSLAYACGAALRAHRLGGHQMLYIGTKPESIDEARDGLLQEAELLRQEKLSAQELERAREYVIGKFLMGLQSHGQRAGALASWEDIAGDAALAASYPDRLRGVDADQVQAAVQRWLHDPTVAILRPRAS